MISINNLSFHYQKQESFITALSMELKNGSTIGLFGKNGAGKTTLMNTIAGLLCPKGGTLLVNDFNPFDRQIDFLADIFVVPEVLNFPAVKIKTYVSATAPLYLNFDNDKFIQILQEFDVDTGSVLHKISQGQQKKFFIAFALATNCKLLLLDEPTNGLDIPSKSLFRKILVSSVTDDQLVIISTHQVKDIENVIDRLLILDEGKVVFNQSTTEISEKYQFKKLVSVNSSEELLYSERYVGGYRAILRAENEEETDLDIELLFNAVIEKHI